MNELFDALAARAEQREKEKIEVKEFKIGETAVKFQKLNTEKELEYYEKFSEASGAGDLIDFCICLIYECCPTLQEPELHRILGVVDPLDTVRKLLNVHEIDVLAGDLMEWMGLASPKKIKN